MVEGTARPNRCGGGTEKHCGFWLRRGVELSRFAAVKRGRLAVHEQWLFL